MSPPVCPVTKPSLAGGRKALPYARKVDFRVSGQRAVEDAGPYVIAIRFPRVRGNGRPQGSPLRHIIAGGAGSGGRGACGPASGAADPAEADGSSHVPFLFLNEAGAYIDTILDVLKKDRPDAILRDFAGIAGTIAADHLKVPNIMLYTSYPSNDTYSVAESFSGIPNDHPLRIAADRIAEDYAEKYGCRKMTVKEIFDGQGDLNLVMVQKRLVPNYESFDDSFIFTGVQIGKRSAFGSWTAPENGKPLLYSSLGTAFNNWPEYYPILFDAVRDLPINVFAALGGAKASADAIIRFLEKKE